VVVHRCESCGEATVAGPDGEPKKLSEAETERIACDAVTIQPDGTARATIPPRLRRRVLARDGHRCARCGATRFLEIHHRVARARGGGNELANLVTLCSACHHQAHQQADRGGDRGG
jgi:5-methylcytosine-specific restriction endonuclease McrA